MAKAPSDQAHETRLIIAHCMATENTTDPEYAGLIAKMEQFIENGSVTAKGKTLVSRLNRGENLTER